MGKHQPTPESIKPRKVSRRQRMAINDAKDALSGRLHLFGVEPVATAHAILLIAVAKDEAEGIVMEYKRETPPPRAKIDRDMDELAAALS